jgi:hypothetical protein
VTRDRRAVVAEGAGEALEGPRRVRLVPPQAVALGTRSLRRATCTTATVESRRAATASSGSVDDPAGPDAGDAAGVARWSVGSLAIRPGVGAGRDGGACPAERLLGETIAVRVWRLAG